MLDDIVLEKKGDLGNVAKRRSVISPNSEIIHRATKMAALRTEFKGSK